MRKLLIVGLLLTPSAAFAEERICDPQFENCREPLLQLIRNETQGIDIGAGYMSDSRYAQAIIRRYQAGVPVRLLLNPRIGQSKHDAQFVLNRFALAGIPMRGKVAGATFHWKTMLFHGQQTVEFSKANFTAESFVPSHLEEGQHGSRKGGWFDEAVYFTSDLRVFESFRTQFETYWTDVVEFADYANITAPPTRLYPVTPIDPSLNFYPDESFTARVLPLLDAEPVEIDLIEFRVLGEPQIRALIRAAHRGVTIRLITELIDTANPTHVQHRASVERLWRGGVRTKVRAHAGLTHEGLIILRGLGLAVFGSSNLAAASLVDHNLFIGPQTTPLDDGQAPFDWFCAQFTRKWTDTVSFTPFYLWLKK